MNRPLTIVQNMFSICPKRYGTNVPILVYHCWTNLAQNRFIFTAQSNIKLKIYICCIFSGPDLTHIHISSTQSRQCQNDWSLCEAKGRLQVAHCRTRMQLHFATHDSSGFEAAVTCRKRIVCSPAGLFALQQGCLLSKGRSPESKQLWFWAALKKISFL